MVEYAQGPCQCSNDCGNCCFTTCCPCVAYMNAAKDIGSDYGLLYCILTFPFGLGCCSLVALSREVEEKRGIDGGIPKSCVYACCDICCCYSCSVTNESKLIKKEAASGIAPAPSEIKR